jgi:hypothetical protein
MLANERNAQIVANGVWMNLANQVDAAIKALSNGSSGGGRIDPVVEPVGPWGSGGSVTEPNPYGSSTSGTIGTTGTDQDGNSSEGGFDWSR